MSTTLTLQSRATSKSGMIPMPTTAVVTRKGWWSDVARFIHDSEKGTCCGRTSSDTSRVCLFYLGFYASLFGVVIAAISVFFFILDENYPNLQGMQSVLGMTPGLGFRPQPDYGSTLIRFRQGKFASYKLYTDHIYAYLYQYENQAQVGESFIDCSSGSRPIADAMKSCLFNLNWLDPCIQRQEYGYVDGKPCIVLKLNRIYGWVPDPLDQIDYVQGGNSTLGLMGGVMVKCYGRTPMDEQNLGPVAYYPSNIFPSIYFPYLMQDTYRSPLVAVQFLLPAEQILIMIECRAYAKNIKYDAVTGQGAVRFELLID